MAEELGINDEMADKLFRAGGASIDLVAQMPAEYIAQALEIDEDQAAAILAKATPQESPSEEPASEQEEAEAEAPAQEAEVAEEAPAAESEGATEQKPESTEA